MEKFFMSMSNSVVSAVLRSPFHRLMSGSLMLLRFHGRTSGRLYEFPVEYMRHGDTITLFTRRYRRWWMNLQSPAPVTVLLYGQEIAGIAEQLPANHAHMVAALMARYPWMNPDVIEEIADKRVMLTIKLNVAAQNAREIARA